MYDEVCYDRTFLSEVIARIDFATNVPELSNSIPKSAMKEIIKNFSIAEPAESIGHEFQISGESLKSNVTKSRQWRFFGREREKLLAVDQASIFVRYEKYNSFEALQEDFVTVVKALAASRLEVSARRFGLRYVNNIDVKDAEPGDIGDYVDDRLIKAFEFFAESGKMIRCVNVSELQNDDLLLTVRTGFFNPDHPAVMKRPIFTIDIDAHVDTIHSLEESLKYLEQAHAEIQSLFERSITSLLRESMNG